MASEVLAQTSRVVQLPAQLKSCCSILHDVVVDVAVVVCASELDASSIVRATERGNRRIMARLRQDRSYIKMSAGDRIGPAPAAPGAAISLDRLEEF
jgi:hypothetical protein